MKKFVLFFAVLLLAQSPAFAMLSTLRQEAEIENVHTLQKKINDKVCVRAQEVYEKINKNWTYVPSRGKMSTDSKFWEATWIRGEAIISGEKQEVNLPTLILKTSPDNITEALDDLINKPASLECTIALTTAKIFCMKDILEEMKKGGFKVYANSFHKALSATEGWTTDQFFHELPLQFTTQVNGNTKPGSIGYISNVPFYEDFKPNGNGRGSNVFCVKDNECIGFCDLYKKGPQSLEVIEKQDFELFCNTQDVERDHEEHGELCQMFRKEEGLFERFRREEQRINYNFHVIFDAQKFIELMNTGKIYL